MDAKYQTGLCSICRSIVCPKEFIASKGWIKAAAQTFNTFREAVRNKCIICSVVWDLSFQYRHTLSKSPQLWEQMSFRPYKDSDDDNIVKLHVLYKNPLKDHRVAEGTEAKFRLIPVDNTEVQEQLAFPTVQRSVQYDVLLATGRRWLSQYQSSHPQRNRSPSFKHNWHPTRLLDIGEEGNTSWKLRIVSEYGIPSPSAPYLTLSYRWAHKPNAILLSSNITRFRSGSPIRDLPILFREFISIAWHFSIRHIWIDALCIIQDSEEDWNTEAPIMHLVYSNSTCNVAASDSANPEESLFYTRNLELILPGRVESSLFSTEPRQCYIFDKSYWDRQICNGPLHNRGWVFQERFLAPRVLYFGKNQLLWECLTQHRCEVFPNGIPMHWSDKAMDALVEASPTDDALKSRRFSTDKFNLWNDLVQNYSRCDLTYPSDKLLALAGVAKLFQGATNDSYIAGLWSSHLLAMMDWRVYDPRPRQCPKYRAPSWSWASIDGPIRRAIRSVISIWREWREIP